MTIKRILIITIILMLLTGCSKENVKYSVNYHGQNNPGVSSPTMENNPSINVYDIVYENSSLLMVVSEETVQQFTNPVKDNYVMTSPFGERWGRNHNGVDIAIPEGTSLYAAADGTVISVTESDTGYGICIIIDHGEFKEGTYSTLYAHLSDKCNTKVGDYVKAGDFIGKSGNTGNSTGPHLHFEIKCNDIAQDPELFIDF